MFPPSSQGIYYGSKLGHHVPWVTGYPFSVVAHPQYVGAVMTVGAAVVLLFNQLPGASSGSSSGGIGGSEVVWIGALWTGLYVVTGLHEHYF